MEENWKGQTGLELASLSSWGLIFSEPQISGERGLGVQTALCEL